MQPGDREVDDDPVEQHHGTADDRENRRPHALVLGLQPDMDQHRVDDERVQCEDFLGIPSPWSTPGMIRPDGAHHQTRPEQDEGKLHQNHGRTVQHMTERRLRRGDSRLATGSWHEQEAGAAGTGPGIDSISFAAGHEYTPDQIHRG